MSKDDLNRLHLICLRHNDRARDRLLLDTFDSRHQTRRRRRADCATASSDGGESEQLALVADDDAAVRVGNERR